MNALPQPKPIGFCWFFRALGCATLLSTFPAIDGHAQTITQLWSFPTQGYISSSPAISDDGTVFVSSSDRKLYAINPDGSKKWEFASPGPHFGSPSIGVDGSVYVGASDGRLYAIDSGGTKKWEFLTGGTITGCPAIGADGTIYIGSYDNRLYAVFPDGTKRWAFLTEALISDAPAIGSDGTIYVGSHNGTVHAINTDGTSKWFVRTHKNIQSSPAIDTNGNIYICATDANLYSWTSNGVHRWTFPAGSGVTPTIGPDGTIYIAPLLGNYVYAINPDGTQKWSILKQRGSAEGAIAIAQDGTLYGSAYNQFYALNPDGSPNWFFEGAPGAGSPAVGRDGRIFFGGNDGSLYAFHGASPLAQGAWPMYGRTATHSGRARLQSPGPATIVLQPASQSSILNANPYFIVAADGSEPLAFQWLKDGALIHGATNSMLRLNNVKLVNQGSYSVVVSNALGVVTSVPANLTVDPSIQIALYAGLTIEGEAGRLCQIEYSDDLRNTNNWKSLTNFSLPTDRFLWFDTESPNVTRRYYRATLAP